MKRLAAIGAVLAAAAPAQAHHGRRCHSSACEARVSHKRALKIKQAVVHPYRGWLRAVAWCESTNRLTAVSPDGRYLGLFQFDLQTWRSVGGWGSPVNASRLEQQFRAVRLLQARGSSPWPICGSR